MNPAIIGGGYAGMAAAVSLAARGIPVTVFESAKQLGGRARGVMHNDTHAPSLQLSPEGGESSRPLRGNHLILDNGQHLLLGCYRQTLRLIEQVGGNLEQDFLRLPLQLDLHGEFSFKAPRLPAPLHLLVALLSARGLPFGARLNAVHFMLALRRINFTLPSPERSPSPQSSGETTSHSTKPASGQVAGYPASGRGGERERQFFNPCGGGAGGEGGDMTVAELLAQHGQDAELAQKLWEPLCIAALNTPIHKASAQVLLNVLRDALNRSRADSDMLLPRVDFTALFPQRAASYVEQRGGKVLTSCGVEAIAPKDGGIELTTAEGTTIFSHVICAAPPVAAAKLMRSFAALENTVAQIDGLEHQPIYTVYLRYPAHVTLPHPMIGLHRRFSQWLFDKGQIAGQHGLLAAVISAEGVHQELPQEQLAQKVIAELREEFGIAGPPEWFKVIAEKRATFCCAPGLQRPSQQTALPGLLLAGDYTAGDYPATLEGAVLSGLRCASLISA